MRTRLILALLAIVVFAQSCSGKSLEQSIRGFEVFLPSELITAAEAADVDLASEIDDALGRIESSLDPEPVMIAFKVGRMVIPQAGLVGFTDPSSGDVDMTVDPDTSIGLKQSLTHWLPAQLAHELHHSKRVRGGPGYGRTLRHALVSEGLADAYASEVYPDVKAPWTDAISVEQERDAWSRARPLLNQSYDLEDHARWFFGAGDLPNWTGYTLGFRTAKRYLEANQGVTAAEAFAAAAADVSAFGGSS